MSELLLNQDFAALTGLRKNLVALSLNIIAKRKRHYQQLQVMNRR